MNIFKSIFVVGMLAFVAMGCSPSASQLQKTLEENPEVLANAIKKNPVEVMTALNDAAQEARKARAQNEEQAMAQARDDEFKNPKKPEISEDRAILGPKSAPIMIVEYSDFQCPFCSRGYQTIQQVKKKYGDKVRFMYKHLPLDFHPLALPAAKYFEAIALQSEEKAYEFHDYVFENQDKLTSDGAGFLESAAKKVGANLGKVKKDMESDKVLERIEQDKAEARKFGISGTPGFLINGVSLKGAYPASEFEKIIEQHLKNM